MKGFVAAYGPIATALLVGSLGLLAIACAVGLMLAAHRMFFDSGDDHNHDGYRRVELKDDNVVFDADCVSP